RSPRSGATPASSRPAALAGFLLKRMIQVRVVAAPSQPAHNQEIDGQQKDSPALELADVHSLMGPAPVQTQTIPGQDDVPQGHRRAAVPQAVPSEQPANDPAASFDHPATNLQSASTH